MDGASTGLEVIRHFAEVATPDERRGVLDEVADVRQQALPDAALEQLLLDLDMSYSLAADGMTASAWFDAVHRELS